MAELENTNAEVGTEEVTTEEVKTYTQEEVDRLLQSEADRRVTMALAKAEKKNADKLREAEKLAKMNEAEKYEYELERREKAIADKERELALAENKNEASKILAEKGIDLQLVEFVVAEDAETMADNIQRLDRAFKHSVKIEVEKRLGSNSPKKNLPPDETITKESFKKMSLAEQNRLAMDNPSLYKELTTR